MLSWLTRLETVRQATTDREREAIYRFRYQVYIEELKYNYPADHERKWLKQAEDDEPSTILLYTGTPEDISSSIRVSVWKPGEVPPDIHRKISLDLFPGIEKLTVAHMGRLMIRRTVRGKLVLPSLLAGMYGVLAGEKNADLVFMDCVPGIVRYYRQLGARPYGGRLIDLGYSPGVPLVIAVSDHAHLKRCGSIVAPLVGKYFGRGKRPYLDLKPFQHLLEGSAVPVELDSAKVWQELQDRLVDADGNLPAFADAIPASARKRVASSGFLLDIDEGQLVTREGIGQREMFLILEGACEVEAGGRRIALLEKGQIFGEVAFFLESGERTATVRALSRCRLFVLRQKFLEELTRTDPEASVQLLLSVGRVMAERLAGMIRNESRAPELDANACA